MKYGLYEFLQGFVLLLMWIFSLYYILGVTAYGGLNANVLGIGILVITVLSFLLALMSNRRNRHIHQAGEIEIEELEPGMKTYSLSLNSDPEDLVKYEQIVFRIKPPS